MATSRSQRMGIWIITGALVIGTLGSFAVLVLSPKNQASDQARFDQLSAEYSKQYSDYQAKVTARNDKIANELSPKYYSTLKQYESRVSPFDAGSVKELKKEDLTQGTGEELTENSSFTAYYIGWNPAGKIFDSSINGDKLKAPLDVAPGSVIKGWSEGVVGMKVGGVRELTIPADQAYGNQAPSEDIPANTPLKFIIMVIPKPDAGEQLTPPKMSDELKRLYTQIKGIDPSILEQMQ